jgi:hypothetical protein
MSPDSKWLEILKASGWQTSAIAVACAGLFGLIRFGLLQSPGALPLFLVAAAGIVCACLAVASMLSALFRFIPPGRWILHWQKIARERHAVKSYIPHMTEEERGIVGYLLARNQKMFTGASDGGNATTLISRGIIVQALRPGQIFTSEDMPFAIPDHIWDVLAHHRDQFPSDDLDPDAPYPWRVHWMAR